MGDYTAPLTLIDERDTGFIGIDMLNKTNVTQSIPKKVDSCSGRKDIEIKMEMV